MNGNQILITGTIAAAALLLAPAQTSHVGIASGDILRNPPSVITATGNGMRDIVEMCRQMKLRWLQDYTESRSASALGDDLK